MILIDLRKTFDAIDHDTLLQKLHANGFSKYSVNWLRSYLVNRTFLVNLRNVFSQPACTSSGALQGSIPALDVIHIKQSVESVIDNKLFTL